MTKVPSSAIRTLGQDAASDIAVPIAPNPAKTNLIPAFRGPISRISICLPRLSLVVVKLIRQPSSCIYGNPLAYAAVIHQTALSIYTYRETMEGRQL